MGRGPSPLAGDARPFAFTARAAKKLPYFRNAAYRVSRIALCGSASFPPFRPLQEIPMSVPDNRVVVTGVQIPFGEMVVLILKFVLASIPAYIIMMVIMMVIVGIFGGIFGGLMGGLK
jgi:hypothetical protein